MSDDDKKERARRRRVETGRELEGRGFLDQAVREYVKAGAPDEAARALASVGRLGDAAKAILEALAIQPGEVGTVEARHRDVLEQAAVFFRQTGDAASADAIQRGLATPPPGAARASAPPASAPPTNAPRSSAPPSSPSAPRAASPPAAPPVAASSPKMPGFASKPAFRPPSAAPVGSFRPPGPAAPDGARPAGFRSPSAAPSESTSVRPPSASVRAPARVPSSDAPSGEGAPRSVLRSPSRAPSSPAAPAASRVSFAPPVDSSPRASSIPATSIAPSSQRPSAPPSEPVTSPPASAPSHPAIAPSASDGPAEPRAAEARLSASGEVVTEHTRSREAGWRDAGSGSIDESIRQMLASGRKGAAARVAWDAGRHEQALEWFLELDLHYQAGACLRALGRMDEAIEALLRVPTDGPHYRKACFELVPAARAQSRIDFDVDRFFARFVEHGPQDAAEIPTFLELAELYRDGEFAQGATRCVSKILALDAGHARALALRADLGARVAPARPSTAVSAQRGLPELPSLDEFIALARANAPPS